MKLQQVFQPLEPPPGGLSRLRGRLRANARRGSRRATLLVATAAVTVGVTIACLATFRWFLPATSKGVDLVAELERLEQRSEPVLLSTRHLGGVARIPTQNPEVVFYRVSILGPPQGTWTETREPW